MNDHLTELGARVNSVQFNDELASDASPFDQLHPVSMHRATSVADGVSSERVSMLSGYFVVSPNGDIVSLTSSQHDPTQAELAPRTPAVNNHRPASRTNHAETARWTRPVTKDVAVSGEPHVPTRRVGRCYRLGWYPTGAAGAGA